MKAKVSVNSGIALSECSWAIQKDQSTNISMAKLLQGLGIIEGASCIIEDETPISKLAIGTYLFVIEAVDKGHRQINRSANRSYARFKVAR